MTKEFYYREWKEAEKEGNLAYAFLCKGKYYNFVMETLFQPYNVYYPALPYFKFIYLN